MSTQPTNLNGIRRSLMTNSPQAPSKSSVHSHTQECRDGRDGIRQTIRGLLGIKVLAEEIENAQIDANSQRHLFVSVVASSSVEPRKTVSRQEKLDCEGWAVRRYILRSQVRLDVRAMQIPAVLSIALSRGHCRGCNSKLVCTHNTLNIFREILKTWALPIPNIKLCCRNSRGEDSEHPG